MLCWICFYVCEPRSRSVTNCFARPRHRAAHEGMPLRRVVESALRAYLGGRPRGGTYRLQLAHGTRTNSAGCAARRPRRSLRSYGWTIVIAIDTNILVYAQRAEAPHHAQATALLTGLAEGENPWALPWPCIYEFLRVVTHPRVFDPPTDLDVALEDLGSLLESPSVVLLGGGAGSRRAPPPCGPDRAGCRQHGPRRSHRCALYRTRSARTVDCRPGHDTIHGVTCAQSLRPPDPREFSQSSSGYLRSALQGPTTGGEVEGANELRVDATPAAAMSKAVPWSTDVRMIGESERYVDPSFEIEELEGDVPGRDTWIRPHRSLAANRQ